MRTTADKRTILISVGAVFAAIFSAIGAQGKIVRIQIDKIESPTFEGRSFGDVGQYEKLVGRAFGEIDTADPRNAVITDIGMAPTNDRGLVEYSMDIYVLN